MEIVQSNTTFHWWLGLLLHGRIVTIMRRLLITSKRLIASDYLAGRASTRQSRPDATDYERGPTDHARFAPARSWSRGGL